MIKQQLPKVALIYDFDGTLSPHNMQEYGFINSIGRTAPEFWDMCDSLGDGQEMSGILAYMKMMIDECKRVGIAVTRDHFVKFGESVELFPGVKEWFKLINEYGESIGVEVEHYINSSGLTEMIEGTPIANEFKKIFACSFLYDENGLAVWPAVAVDYTAKTQFLFKISKGILDLRDNVKVNESTKDEEKPILFPNMIYFGDGQTDVPCMKIVKMFGGNSIAVYQADNSKKRAAAQKLIDENRVNFICNADYREGSYMHRVVCTILDKIKVESRYNIL